MIFRLCLGQALLVALVHCAAVTNVKKDPETGEARIVNGSACPIKDHPYMVDIRMTQGLQRHCGGSLISKLFILTAGHCCLRNLAVGFFTVFVGVYIENKTNGQYIVENFKRHNRKVDICLMKVQHPIYQGEGVRYVQLATSEHTADEDILQSCKSALAIGHGMQYPKDLDMEPVRTPLPPYDPRLQCVRMSALSLRQCQLRNRNWVSTNFICAYSKGKGVCHGDSGGPLLCNRMQYGIISQTRGCAYRDYASKYLRVDRFEDWIQGVITHRSLATGLQGNNCLVLWVWCLVYLCTYA